MLATVAVDVCAVAADILGVAADPDIEVEETVESSVIFSLRSER